MKLVWRVLTIHIIASLLAIESGWTATYQLFHNGMPNFDYDSIVKNLSTGDTLHFSDGNTFTIRHILGQGNSAFIFVSEEHPQVATRIALRVDTLEMTAGTFEGYKSLQLHSIPAVEVYGLSNFKDASGQLTPEYLIVELVDGPFITFKDFVKQGSRPISEKRKSWLFRHWDPRHNLPEQEMKEKFIEFSRTLGRFWMIGDMHQDNLIYDFKKKQWRLMDWTPAFQTAFFYDLSGLKYIKQLPFDMLVNHIGFINHAELRVKNPMHNWLIPLFAEAAKAVLEEREKIYRQESGGNFCAGLF